MESNQHNLINISVPDASPGGSLCHYSATSYYWFHGSTPSLFKVNMWY